MPVIRRWKYEPLMEDIEEIFGAEMRPYLSAIWEEEATVVQENQLEEIVSNSILDKSTSSNKFWSKLMIFVQRKRGD